MSLSLSYTFKRLIRSWRLFTALLLGIVLAATFFAGINIGADTAAKQALEKALSQVLVDFVISTTIYKEPGRLEYHQFSSQNVTEIVQRIKNIDDIKNAEAVSRLYLPTRFSNSNETYTSTVAGITVNSSVFSEVSALKENETYVWEGAAHVNNFHVGDVLSFNLTIFTDVGLFELPLNLKVKGLVRLNNRELAVASGQYYGGQYAPYFYGDLFIASWEETFKRIIDYYAPLPPRYGSQVNTDVLVYLDRSAFISPWDVSGSLSRLETVKAQINDQIRKFDLEAQSSSLASVLASYQSLVIGMRFLFIITSFPVFLVAWYMGSTVSDVSFNLRRREIGLLLTKGFSRRQLLQMFFAEAVMIGLIGGLMGIILSLVLNPVFVKAVGGEFSGTPFVGTDTIVITVVFSLILTFLASFQPARRASRLATVDALREYMPREDTKPHRRVWPWLAFGLGSYKIIILLLGVSLAAAMSSVMFSGNIALILLLFIALVVDGILTYIGPFLFFWGCTKIFIRGSVKFQEIVAAAAKFLGDLGTLATKSVQRNPARAASIAFLLASIIFYSVWVSGTLASEQDHAVREIYFQVGADVSVSFKSPQNVSIPMQRITENLSDVLASSTLEYSLYGTAGPVKAVNPENWLGAAYYENEFFSGNDAKKAFELLASNNETIIMELGYAQYLKKELGDIVSISLGQDTLELKIVGFFGLSNPSSFETVVGPFGPTSYYSSRYWSFISDGLFRQLGNETTRYSTPSLLIKLKEGADSKAVADRVRANKALGTSVSQVSSVSEQLEAQQSNVMLMGQFNLLRLGVIFVVLASSIGTALVTLVSLRERGRETAIMNVRGLSFPQLLVMLLTENLAVVTFAVLLGAVVGLIAVSGTIASSNVTNLGATVNRHIVFPFETTLTIVFSIALIFASTIMPVVFMAKRSSSRLERRVREI